MTTIDDYLEASQNAHLDSLCELLRIPSVSTDPAHAEDVARAAEWVANDLRAMSFATEVIPTAGHPIVYAEWLGAPGKPTVLIYGHYDVQPPDPVELWRNPPFEPTIEGGNIVARGATDDKGQFYAHLKGCEAHMRTTGSLPVNVKFVIEGEEEIGSPNLEPFLAEHRERLAADIVLVSDTSMYAPGRPAITWGLRGLAYFEVHVKGPSHDLHSGLYGGAVKNPINALCEMIGKLHDEQGRVTVDGFYDDVRPLTEQERAETAALGHDEAAFRAEIGVSESVGEAGYTVLEQTASRPTLDCNGIWGGYTGAGAKTVLPSEAHAKFSCRLVADQDPRDIEDKVEAWFAANAPAGVEVSVKRHHGAPPFLVDRSAPAISAAVRALERVWQTKPVFIRSGGSIPIVASFKHVLGLDTILMGFGLADDRLHSPNEKFGLENFRQGIRSSAYVLEELGRSGA
jgi:acetylornithine deacetylase/succinyl-diaminopimelate desuccinylase-like protein